MIFSYLLIFANDLPNGIGMDHKFETSLKLSRYLLAITENRLCVPWLILISRRATRCDFFIRCFPLKRSGMMILNGYVCIWESLFTMLCQRMCLARIHLKHL